MSVDLFQPVLGGGIRDPYFFNGRLLSAEDMGALQKAEVQRLRRIGRVLGAGVAFGLDVRLNDTSTAEQPVLSVTPGVALDHRGEALELPEAVDVTLLRDEPASGTQGYFAVCPPPRPTATPTNPDLYLLAMTGSSGYEGSVPMTEVGSGGVATSCGRQYRVHGVSFRLLRMPLADDLPWPAEHISPIAQELETRFYQVAEGTVSDAAQSAIRHNVNRLRNALAYAFFQPGELTDFATRPFDGERAAATDAAPFEALWSDGHLAPCEVPLGIVYWTRVGVRFVDPWIVRRPLAPAPVSAGWGTVAGTRRITETLAMALQFQRQLDDLRRTDPDALTQMQADQDFFYLPPAGLLPIGGIAGHRGVDRDGFFTGRTVRPEVHMEGARLDAALRLALRYPPIDLRKKELIWRYVTRENRQALAGDPVKTPPFVCFINGQVPFQAAPFFDLAYYDYANYA